MASSVWTATVWGQGKAAILAATNRKLQPGEEECHICKDDVPASVALRPCGHMICFGCVENLRAKNIFRADKGVKCPFCRQYVQQYEPCNSADPEQVRLLNEANRAAAFASAGRAPTANGTAGAAPRAATAAAPAEESWMCNSCRCLNLAHREECSSCGRPNPRPKQAAGGARSRDVLKCSDEEVIGFMLERNQPALQRCYSEAGLGFSVGRIVTDADTPQRILNAFKQRGEERLMRVVKMLANPEVFMEVATHFLGNYGLQTLVEATLKIREAIELAETQGQSVLAWFRSANEGRDPHAVLLYAALPNAVELSKHERGNYLIQKLADHAEPQELVELCRAVFEQGPALARENKGVYVMNKLLSMLKKVCSDGVHRYDSCELADGLCWQFMDAPDKLKFCLHNNLASKVLASAIALGLPQYGALRLGSQVASSAMKLMYSKHGVSCVMSMLEIESIDAICSELVRDLLCTVAMKLQGSLYGLLMRITCTDERAPEVVRLLLQRLAGEQEEGWLDAICQELVNYGDVISENPEALEVLKDALCFNVQDDESVVDHITQLRQIVPSRSTMKAIEEDVCNRRDSNPEAPAPRYFAPSVITPDLKYMLAKGVPLPFPPPPPPRPGDAGAYVNDAAAAAYNALAGALTHGPGGGGRGGRAARGRGAQRKHANATFDDSFFAEGLFDPTAPVQASGGGAEAAGADDGWGASSGDPWANVSTGEDWLAADGPAAAAQLPPPLAAAAPAPAPAPAPVSANSGHLAGQMLLQSLQKTTPAVSAAPAAAPPPPVANGRYPVAPAVPAPAPAQVVTPVVVAVQPRSLVPPNPAVAPVVAPRPTGHPLLPANLAVNPTLAAARAVAHAAMQAQQQQATQPQQPPQPQVPQYYQQVQQQQQPQAVQAPPQQQLYQQVPVVAVQPQVTTLQGQHYHPAQQAQHQQQQQQPLPYPPIVGAAGPGTYLSRGGASGVGPAAAAAPAGPMATPSYMPPAQPRPQAPAMPYPMALFNPALAVLNNTSGIAAFAPRAHTAGVLRPVAVPVAQVPVAVPMPPQPSVNLTAAAQPAGSSSSTAVASAAAAAAAAAARRAAGMTSGSARQSQPQSLPPPPAAAPGSLPPPPAAAPAEAWQCAICTYEHKANEANFLACAVCGCEKGLASLA